MTRRILDWLQNASHLDVFVYFEGNLADTRARFPLMDEDAQAKERPALDEAAEAWQLCDVGLVTLTQRRHAPGVFHYLATRTRARLPQGMARKVPELVA